jgi:hypothetical protein
VSPHGPKSRTKVERLMSNPTRNHIFISYSHADRKWLKRLQTMLGPLVSDDKLIAWADTMIKPGQKWREAIEKALTTAGVAVLLVSDNFLASDFITKYELPRILNAAEREGMKILWVALSHCLYEETEIRDYQAAHNPNRPLDSLKSNEWRQELVAISRQIKEAVEAQVNGDPLQETKANKETPISLLLNPDNINIARLTDRSRQLFGREHELDMLDAAWVSPDINIVSLIAWGGVGKSALVNHWLHRMGQRDYGGADKVYVWSFYRQGTTGHDISADEFIANALSRFGDLHSTEGSQWGKGERLANLIGKQRTLLILDGLEPLQYPPRSGVEEGRLKEESMRALLRGLATVNPGLCIITSRLPISDLTDNELYKARRVNLEHLSAKAGAELLKAEGVFGEEDELEQASIDFGGHALALTLLGGYLSVVHEGDINRRDEVDIMKQDEEAGGHAQRVMASYEKWFGDGPELAVLRMIALFDRPADGPIIAALRKKSNIRHLTEPLKNLSEEDWQRTLARLRKAKLIAEKDPDQPDTLDAHPLVREYFKKQLKQHHLDAWVKGNDQLFEYLSRAVKEYPDTKEEMYFLYRAVAHACQANRHQWAFVKVYYDRIQRRHNFYAPNKLGTVGNDIAALSCFFEAHWTEPVPRITGRWRALLFGQAGYRLWMLGRLKEAVTPMMKALVADIAREAWKYASVDADSLASIHLTLGNLCKALYYSVRGVDLAFDSDDPDQIVSALSTLGDVLHHRGYLSESQEIFELAERIKGKESRVTSSQRSLGHRRHDLLLSQGKYSEIEGRVKQIIECQGTEVFNLIDSALLHLFLGQAHLFQARDKNTEQFAQAETNLNLAMDELRRAGRLVHLPRGRLALAELHLMARDFKAAKINLDEALGTATRSNMELHQADCHLTFARLYLEQRENEKALESWAKAKEIIDRRGYRLRDADSHLLSARLYIARGEKEKAQVSWAEAKQMIERMGYHHRSKDIKEIEEQVRGL